MIEKSENGSYITPLGILAPNGYFIEKKNMGDEGKWANLVAAAKVVDKEDMEEIAAIHMNHLTDPDSKKDLNKDERVELKNEMQDAINSKEYQNYLKKYIEAHPGNFRFLKKYDNSIEDKLSKSPFLQGVARAEAGDLAWLEKTGKSLVDLSILPHKNIDAFLKKKIDLNEKIKQLASNDINGNIQGTLGGGLFSILPAFLIPNEILGEGILTGFTKIGAPVVPMGAIKWLSAISSKSLAGALQGYFSMLDDENQDLGTILGAVANPIISILPHALNLPKLLNKMKISMPKYASTLVGRASKNLDKLKKAVAASPSGHVILGKVLEDPNLLKMEMNILPGVNDKFIEKFKQISKDLQGQAAKIFKMLTTNQDFLKIGNRISEDIRSNYKKLKEKSDSLYKTRNEIADKNGIQVDSKTILEKIKKLKSENEDAYITGVDTLKKAGGILKKVSQAMSERESIISEKKAALEESENSIFNKKFPEFHIFKPKSSKEPPKFSIQEAQKARSELYKEGDNSLINDRRTEGGLFKQISKIFDDAIEEAISKGPRAVKEAQAEADQFYQDNIVPFNSKFVRKIMAKKVDTDLIPQAFITAKADNRLNLLNEFSKIAPNSMQDLITFYLDPALNAAGSNEAVNPFILKNILKNSARRLPFILEKLKHLDPQKASEDIEEFMTNMENNEDALKFMQNPKTGAQNVLADTAAYLTDNAAAAIKHAASGNVGGLLSSLSVFLLMKAESLNLYKSELPEEVIKQTEEFLEGKGKKSLADKLKKISKKMLITSSSAEMKSNNETE